jgi:uncharacterized OB-fold protein
MLVQTIEHAKPGDRCVVAGFCQGCDVLVIQRTARPLPVQSGGVAASLKSSPLALTYTRYLAATEMLTVDWGKRAETNRQTPLTTLYRNRDLLTSFTGGRCAKCDTVQFPRAAICVNPECRARDSQEPQSFADLTGQISSWSADNLTFSLSPPACYGHIDFDGGGRLMMDFADADPTQMRVGDRVSVAFRIKDYDRSRGFPRYFWKATPLQIEEK